MGPSKATRKLARKLLALEAAEPHGFDPRLGEAARACEALRIEVTRFSGADGFTALMRRALAMARAEEPSLQAVEVKPDGSIEGLEDIPSDAAAALAAHLLYLLVTFIGEAFTQRLVSDAWPNLDN